MSVSEGDEVNSKFTASYGAYQESQADYYTPFADDAPLLSEAASEHTDEYHKRRSARFGKYIILFGALAVVILVVVALTWKHSSNTSPPGDRVTIIILPHSHDDLGWTSTVDQYYNIFVQNIYSTGKSVLAPEFVC